MEERVDSRHGSGCGPPLACREASPAAWTICKERYSVRAFEKTRQSVALYLPEPSPLARASLSVRRPRGGESAEIREPLSKAAACACASADMRAAERGSTGKDACHVTSGAKAAEQRRRRGERPLLMMELSVDACAHPFSMLGTIVGDSAMRPPEPAHPLDPRARNAVCRLMLRRHHKDCGNQKSTWVHG